MNSPFVKYLSKYGVIGRWPLESSAVDGVDMVVVIPVLQEEKTLPATLASLEKNDDSALDRTLVICVVNNRPVQEVGEAVVRENRSTIEWLSQRIGKGKLRLAYVDACSPGKELPSGQGVGLARKIGMDWAVKIMMNQAPNRGIICSLDADTRVESNYLSVIRDLFDRKRLWAAVTDYAHPMSSSAIILYELFLRYHSIGLRFAKSPYSFHAIGSTMVCRMKAYVAVSGMPCRLAGEDFYFLQKLAKTGGVSRINETVVIPSPRESRRTPFGTGMAIAAGGEHSSQKLLVYHPKIYSILSRWLEIAGAFLDYSATELLEQAERIEPELAAYLRHISFEEVWKRICANSSLSETRKAQFHGWFDGLKTLKLIHWLQEHGYPMHPMGDSYHTLLSDFQHREILVSMPPDCLEQFPCQQRFLEKIRVLDRSLYRWPRDTATDPFDLD